MTAAPMAWFALPDLLHAFTGGSLNGWAFVGMIMLSPIIIAGSSLIGWGVIGLAVRALTGGVIGFKVVGQGVLIGLALQLAMLAGVAACPHSGGC